MNYEGLAKKRRRPSKKRKDAQNFLLLSQTFDPPTNWKMVDVDEDEEPKVKGGKKKAVRKKPPKPDDEEIDQNSGDDDAGTSKDAERDLEFRRHCWHRHTPETLKAAGAVDCSWVSSLAGQFLVEVLYGRSWGETFEERAFSLEKFLLCRTTTAYAISECRSQNKSVFGGSPAAKRYRNAVALLTLDDARLTTLFSEVSLMILFDDFEVNLTFFFLGS